MSHDHAELRTLNELARPLIDRDALLQDARTLGRLDALRIYGTARHAGTHPRPLQGCHTCDLLADMRGLLNPDDHPGGGAA